MKHCYYLHGHDPTQLHKTHLVWNCKRSNTCVWRNQKDVSCKHGWALCSWLGPHKSSLRSYCHNCKRGWTLCSSLGPYQLHTPAGAAPTSCLTPIGARKHRNPHATVVGFFFLLFSWKSLLLITRVASQCKTMHFTYSKPQGQQYLHSGHPRTIVHDTSHAGANPGSNFRGAEDVLNKKKYIC